MSDDYTIGSTPQERELPPTGLQQAVITGVYNIGRMFNSFQNQYKPIIKVKFELAATNKHGNKFVVYNEYTASMHAKATLRSVVHAIEGRDLSETEAAGYSLKNLLGRQVTLNLAHKAKSNGVDMKYVIKNVLPATGHVEPSVTPEIWSYTERTKDAQYHCKAPRWVWEAHMKSKDYIPPATPYVEPVRTQVAQQVQQAQQPARPVAAAPLTAYSTVPPAVPPAAPWESSEEVPF